MICVMTFENKRDLCGCGHSEMCVSKMENLDGTGINDSFGCVIKF